jgi:hypothetical protein
MMNFIQNFLARRKEKENKLKDWQENDDVYRVGTERKQSHNERELKKILEQERQEAIKEALHWEEKCRQLRERKKSRDMMKFNPQMWNDNSILKQNNQFLRGGWND